MKLSLRQIEIFLSVARTGNVSRSAEELLLSQSAVSMSLSEMERLLGGSLFDRPGKRLHLNERGRLFLPRALEINDRMDEAEQLLAGKLGSITGSLNIVASSTVGNYLIPGIMAAFVKKNPDTHLMLDVGNTEDAVRKVLSFEADIGFIEGHVREAMLQTKLWRRDQLVVFVSPRHPLAKKTKIIPDDLIRNDWILRERGSGTREVFENAIRGKLEIGGVLLELGDTEAIKTAVETGIGISCLSRLAMDRSLREGLLVELHTPFLQLERELYVLLHREKYRSILLDTFLVAAG